MKKIVLIFFGFLWLLPGKASVKDSASVQQVLSAFDVEVREVTLDYRRNRGQLIDQLQDIQSQVNQPGHSTEKRLQLLIERLGKKEALEKLEKSYQLSLTERRYKKGLELIRLLYEKILGLDHHFSSLRAHQSIASLSNPNMYPEFQQANELISRRLKKDYALSLPPIVQTNPYLSGAFTLVSSILGNGNADDRQAELEQVSCILDFTARMHAELSTIYYETEYLRESNLSLKEECIQLFKDYVDPIDYHTPLDVCRAEDDWETVNEQLTALMQLVEERLKSEDEHLEQWVYKQQINLEFAVDRLLTFIDHYNSFISQGERYYQKFQVIVENYPNEKRCLSQLPPEFQTLKADIDFSIQKFNEAYNLSSLQGSKMKDLLYGMDD